MAQLETEPKRLRKILRPQFLQGDRFLICDEVDRHLERFPERFSR